MAMQIMYGEVNEKEFTFNNEQQMVNLTENLSAICGKYISEKDFLEDDELVTYSVITADKIKKMLGEIDKNMSEVIVAAKKTRGNEEKNILLDRIYDYSLLKTQMIEMLLVCENRHKALLALV